jgi:hypothetical protein
MHSRDSRRGGGLFLLVQVGSSLGGHDDAGLRQLVWGIGGGVQVPAECGQVDQHDPGQLAHARLDIRGHAQVEHDQCPPAGWLPGCPHV